MSKEIELTNGMKAIVDDDDFERVNRNRWNAKRYSNTFYAMRRENGKTILLHRFILNTPDELLTDHIDRNGLNCSKKNLRVCSRKENSRNTNKRSDNKSGYKGVFYNKHDKRWRAQIKVNGKTIFGGNFTTAIEAAIEYDRLAKKHHGAFASPNFGE